MTRWKLELNAKLNKHIPLEVVKDVERHLRNTLALSLVFDRGVNQWGESETTFGYSDSYMYTLSKQYPQIIFMLKYDPILNTDDGRCIEYWLNGKVQKEEVGYLIPPYDTDDLRYVVPPFDLEKLISIV